MRDVGKSASIQSSNTLRVTLENRRVSSQQTRCARNVRKQIVGDNPMQTVGATHIEMFPNNDPKMILELFQNDSKWSQHYTKSGF